MKHSIFSLLLILTTSIVFTQNPTTTKTIVRKYMPINMYKIRYNTPLTKSDSLNFRFKENDTMVLLTDTTPLKGIRVPYEYKDSTFLKYYQKIAFNHKNDSFSDQTAMKYWKHDLNIFFSSSVSKKTKKEFMAFIKVIDKAVDSLNINEVKNVKDSNYTVYYFGDYDYEPRMSHNATSNYYISWKDNKIYRGAIRLDKNSLFGDAVLQYELRKLFIQSLGYFKLLDEFDCDSYFSNCYATNKHLTALDLELLKYHYSYGICKGTSLKEFEEQHLRAKKTLKEHNVRVEFIHHND